MPLRRVSRTAAEPTPVEGARWIPLTQGVFTLVDAADYELLSRYNWTFLCAGSGYAMRAFTHEGKKCYQLMHRLLAGATGRHVEVDHRDGDSLNNRRSNLRICTHEKNRANTRKHKDNTSGFKGVSWNKGAQKWSATTKGIYLGLFEDKVEAAKAYDRAAKRLFGEYANLNFPEAP